MGKNSMNELKKCRIVFAIYSGQVKMLTLAGGIVITFTNEILNMIVG